MKTESKYQTKDGVSVIRQTENLGYGDTSLNKLTTKLSNYKGVRLSSSHEYPDLHTRWDIEFVNPPIEIVAKGRNFTINALNKRGKFLLALCYKKLKHQSFIEGTLSKFKRSISGKVKMSAVEFSEQERLRQPTIFSVLRSLIDLFKSDKDSILGLYGSFGYDLVHQFEPIKTRHDRSDKNDLHLYIPDELIVTDHRLKQTHKYSYDFVSGDTSTVGLERTGTRFPFVKGKPSKKVSDHKPGEYVQKVQKIINDARYGKFFEVVLSQVLSAGYSGTPAELFNLIRETNPSPYEFLINLGHEQLVGSSPEMFVQVSGSMVEVCPISGTVKRGLNAYQDEIRIRELLNSLKDLMEITMTTDVAQNDMSRICKPGSVRLKDRRLIQKYSRLIHTVDHLVGELLADKDGLDALLSNMWAGTLTGAPKHVAMQTIEDMENSARGWYGGCVGVLNFDGNVKTGITIRTVHLSKGTATVRAGATLLAHSDPQSEEEETQLKASVFMDAILGNIKSGITAAKVCNSGNGKRVLIVDNDDSFVHTLGNFVQQTGAEIETYRAGKGGISHDLLDNDRFDLILISPGPGRPDEFKVPELVLACVEKQIPVFGVCLGLQGIIEAFGGKLSILDNPMHGAESVMKVTQPGQDSLWLPNYDFPVGRYHSLYVKLSDLPECMDVLAYSDDGVIMAIAHKTLPIAAVQFHPESIMTAGVENVGLQIIDSIILKFTN